MIGNVTSPDIDFHIYFFLSKTLLYHIDDTTGLSENTSSPLKNLCDSEGVFPLTDTYATQVI